MDDIIGFEPGAETSAIISRLLSGTIHGRTIELMTDPGLDDGCQVEVVVRVKELGDSRGGSTPANRATAAGAMAAYWTEDDDRILEEIAADRKKDMRREPAE